MCAEDRVHPLVELIDVADLHEAEPRGCGARVFIARCERAVNLLRCLIADCAVADHLDELCEPRWRDANGPPVLLRVGEHWPHYPVGGERGIRARACDALEIVGELACARKHRGVVGRKCVVLVKAGLLRRGELWKLRQLLLGIDPSRCQVERRQIRFGEVSIVVALFLDPHRPELTSARSMGCELDAPAPLELGDLLVAEVLQGAFYRCERVHVLDFLLRPERLPRASDREVGVDAEAAFLHAAVGDLQVLENLLERAKVPARVMRIPKIGLAYDLDQWHAAPIEVNGRQPWKPIVQRLACVFFQVQSSDPDRFRFL